MRRLFSISVFLVSSLWSPVCSPSPAFAQPKTCIHWSKVFAEAAVREAAAKKEIFSVAPFYNDTERAGDAWLSAGLQNLLVRFLKTDPKPGVLTENEAALLPPDEPVQYRVGGLFQNNKGWLRAFIQLSDKKGKLLAQFTLETPYPGHKEFFTGLKEVAVGILHKLGRKRVYTQELKAIENETSNVRAYENYIKGREALASYDPNKMDVALLWFQEARREDTRYPGAYLGAIAAYEFLSLYHKQNNQPYGADLQNIEHMMRLAQKQARVEIPKNRYLQAYVHFVSGRQALTKGDASAAAAELEQAQKRVPEDALTASVLGEAYDKLGQKHKAQEARHRAEEINPCLK